MCISAGLGSRYFQMLIIKTVKINPGYTPGQNIQNMYPYGVIKRVIELCDREA